MNTKPKDSPKPLAYQVNPFCEMLGIGRTTFYNLVKAGQLRTVMIGGRRVVPASEADRLLSTNVEQVAA
jgi:excisionase family DNA binding protein